jgi:hypothetical protein
MALSMGVNLLRGGNKKLKPKKAILRVVKFILYVFIPKRILKRQKEAITSCNNLYILR